MGQFKLKPNPNLKCLVNITEFPDEIMLKIILNLDIITFWRIWPCTCKKFNSFYVKNFERLIHLFYPDLSDKFQIQLSKSRPLEILRIMKRMLLPFNIAEETSKKTGKNSSSIEFCPPQIISEWPDETPVPQSLHVLIFTDDFYEEISFENIHSIFVLPKIYGDIIATPKEITSITSQKFPALKRIGHYRTYFPIYFTNFTNSKLDLFFLNNCCFNTNRPIQLSTRIVHIEEHTSLLGTHLCLDSTTEDLIIFYND